MADLIDRQAAIKAIHEEFDECLVWDESGQQTADEVESILTSLPTADVAPVRHGTWGKVNECSECGCQPWYERDIHSLHYCPNCGARMDGEA